MENEQTQQPEEQQPGEADAIYVVGLVSNRDREPYIHIAKGTTVVAQLSMGQARSFAMDILKMAGRTEMDAMVLNFFTDEKLPPEVGPMLMVRLRDYRARLDDEIVYRRRDWKFYGVGRNQRPRRDISGAFVFGFLKGLPPGPGRGEARSPAGGGRPGPREKSGRTAYFSCIAYRYAIQWFQ